MGKHSSKGGPSFSSLVPHGLSSAPQTCCGRVGIDSLAWHPKAWESWVDKPWKRVYSFPGVALQGLTSYEEISCGIWGAVFWV